MRRIPFYMNASSWTFFSRHPWFNNNVRNSFRTKRTRVRLRNVSLDACEGNEDGTMDDASSCEQEERRMSSNEKRNVSICVIGVDLGRRKTGLAVSRGGYAPRPLGVVRTSGWKDLSKIVIEEAKRYEATHLIVGLPRSSSEGEWVSHGAWADSAREDPTTASAPVYQQAKRNPAASQASYCKRFAHCLAQESRDLGLLVYMVDERYTSLDASSRMTTNGRKADYIQGNLDAAAAAIIVERYFENPDAAIPVGRAKRLAKTQP